MSNQIFNNYNLAQDAMIRQAERIGRVQSPAQTPSTTRGEGAEQHSSFHDLLNERIAEQEGISFSKHASMRTQQRNISITGAELEKLTSACEKASQKGIKDALVVMNDSAFILNTSSKKIITVVDKNEMKENVFTHIDGALFI